MALVSDIIKVILIVVCVIMAVLAYGISRTAKKGVKQDNEPMTYQEKQKMNYIALGMYGGVMLLMFIMSKMP